MNTAVLRRLATGALALSCMAGLPVSTAQAASVGVNTDSVTNLDLSWSFVFGDSDLPIPYVGTFWWAEILPSWTGAGWSVVAKYQHLAGPHGEPAEGAPHLMGSVTFVSGSGAGLIMPVQDHESPFPSHLLAHTGSLTANGPAIDPSLPTPPGFAHQIVTHVPEPEQWALMLAGLLGVGALARRRRS